MAAGLVILTGWLLSAWPVKARTEEDFHQILLTRRSIRSFKQKPVPRSIMMKMLNDARFAPSGHNAQPWEFIAVLDKQVTGQVFLCLSWLKQPLAGEEPAAYVVVLGDKTADSDWQVDCAFASCYLILSAWAEGIGSCPVGSIDRAKLRQVLSIPAKRKIFLVIALGYPAEQPTADEGRPIGQLKSGQGYEPWRANTGQLHVPKKTWSEIVYWNKYGQAGK